MTQQPTSDSPLQHFAEDRRGLKAGWFWFLLLGIGLLALGIAAISSFFAAVMTTVVAVTVLGILILIGGVVQVISAFWSPKWSGLVVTLMLGILYIVVGFMLLDAPIAAAAGLTLLLAVFLIVSGVFRITAALAMRFRHWGLYLLNGAVSLILGVLIWKLMLDDKAAYLWVIGIFVGIEMLFAGAGWVAFALAVKNLPDDENAPGAAA